MVWLIEFLDVSKTIYIFFSMQLNKLLRNDETKIPYYCNTCPQYFI